MDEYNFRNFVTEISRIRDKLGDILSYDWVPMPLAITQNITFAVYFYLLIDGVSIHTPLSKESLHVAIIPILMRFAFSLVLNIFYLGWLKCSQVILNPFGEDDDDYEVDHLIERYCEVLSSILTKPLDHPDTPTPPAHHVLPHTVASAMISRLSDTSLIGSMVGKKVPQHEQEVINQS